MTEDPGEDPMPNLFGPAEALPWMDLHGPAIPIVSARRLLQAATRKRLPVNGALYASTRAPLPPFFIPKLAPPIATIAYEGRKF